MPSALTTAVLRIAAGEVGVREVGRNRGERVEMYQAAAAGHPGDPWCAAFVSWCHVQAAAELGIPNPMRPTAGAQAIWRRAPVDLITRQPETGAIFVIDHGGGLGHCGLVESYTPGDEIIVTIEGNTSPGGSREGDGVYRRSRRLPEVNLGYVVYGRALPPLVAELAADPEDRE